MFTVEMLSSNRTKRALYWFTLPYTLKGKLPVRNMSKGSHVLFWLGHDDVHTGRKKKLIFTGRTQIKNISLQFKKTTRVGYLTVPPPNNVKYKCKSYPVFKGILCETAISQSNMSYISHRHVVEDFNDAITSNTDYG